ncbi:MAG TPA: SIR2 family protein [Thermoanaerobaculia bacterium]|jgi:LuxR family glucitol operon transcriptional activator
MPPVSPIPRELIDEFSRGNGCIFVGAGLSAGAGLPSWMELVKPLAAEIEACPPDSSLTDIAQYYVNVYGRRLLVDRLRAALDKYGIKPTEVHKVLATLPVQHFFTTNFDGLLEAAFNQRKRPFHSIVNTEDVSFMDGSTVQLVKLHGDLDHPMSIIITAEDYEKELSDGPRLADLLSHELRTRTVLFLGYSFNDIDLRIILRRSHRGNHDFRRNAFTVQFDPPAWVMEDLKRRGIIVLPLHPEAGSGGKNRALYAWLEELVRCLGSPPAGATTTFSEHQAPTARVTNHNLPPRSGGPLLGRATALDRVVKGLQSRYPLITIEGFPGVGKTSLAIEVGHACAGNRNGAVQESIAFEYVVWISAKDNPDQKVWMSDVLNIIATTINPSPYTHILVDKKQEVDGLLRIYKTLIILDNFDTVDDKELTGWLEKIPEPSKVIITTRQVKLHQQAWSVRLRGLSSGEAKELLRRYASDVALDFVEGVSDETLQNLCEVTGGNPQLMKLTLGRARVGKVRLWEVIEGIKGSRRSRNTEELFEELLSESWKQLSEDARQILLVTPLFVGVSSIRRDPLQTATNLAPTAFDDGLAHCVQSSLLEGDLDQRQFIIHPVTRGFARTQLTEARPDVEEEARRRCSDYYLEFIKRNVIREEPKPRYWNALVSDGMDAIDAEQPIILEVMKWEDQKSREERLVEFVMLLVHYMDSRFLNAERLSYVQKAVSALEKMSGEEKNALEMVKRKEDEALLRIDALGWTYVEEGSLDLADREIDHGFRIAEEFAREEKEDLRALGLAWKARVRIEQNDSASALELIDQALAIECNPWIKFRVNMSAGDIALKQGDSMSALIYYEQAEAEMKEYGPEGYGYQIDPRIGLAYLGVGRIEDAEQKFKKLWGVAQIAIGKLYAEYGLAMVAYKRGEIQSARGLMDEIKAKLSRRTTSNLLLKLIKSQEAHL